MTKRKPVKRGGKRAVFKYLVKELKHQPGAIPWAFARSIQKRALAHVAKK